MFITVFGFVLLLNIFLEDTLTGIFFNEAHPRNKPVFKKAKLPIRPENIL